MEKKIKQGMKWMGLGMVGMIMPLWAQVGSLPTGSSPSTGEHVSPPPTQNSDATRDSASITRGSDSESGMTSPTIPQLPRTEPPAVTEPPANSPSNIGGGSSLDMGVPSATNPAFPQTPFSTPNPTFSAPNPSGVDLNSR